MCAVEGPYPNYHDCDLAEVVLGPRRELHLRLAFPFGGAVSIRFGAITNFASVRAFFLGIERPRADADLDTIDALRPVAGGWLLDLDHGGRVAIRTVKPPSIRPLDLR